MGEAARQCWVEWRAVWGAEGRGRDDRGSPFASAGHPNPTAVALGLRVRDAPPRRGVGHSLDTAPSGRPGPERHMIAPGSVRVPPQQPQNRYRDPAYPTVQGRAPVITARKASVRVRVRVGVGCAHACKSATLRRGLTQGSGSAPGRTHAVSACATRATRLARTRKRALSLVAHQCKLSRTACDRSGTRRVGRARRGDAGRPCLANACEEGPPPRACKR